MAEIPPVPYQAPVAERNGILSQPWAVFFRQLHTQALARSVVTKTAAYAAAISDDVILCNATSAAFTVTLPSADSRRGKVLVIKKIDASANAVTIDGSGAETIDGAATDSLGAQYASLTLMSDGSNWMILGEV